MINKKLNWRSNTFIITVAIILVVINAVMAFIPSRHTRFDISSNKIFSISKESKDFLKSLDSNIEIFVANADGSLFEAEYILSLFDQYSSKVKVKYSVPDEELSAMGIDSLESIPAYTLIVKGKYRSNYILQSEMYCYINDTYPDVFGEMSMSDYSSIVQTLYQYASSSEYYQQMLTSLLYETKMHLNIEEILLSRIEYVSTEYLPHPYYITGHGEPSMTESVLGTNLSSFGCEALDLSMADSLPVDTASLIINSPENDYSNEEIAIISDYLKNGGSLVLVTDPENAEMPNLMSLVQKYGVSTTPNLIALDIEEEVTEEETTEEEATEGQEDSADEGLTEEEEALYSEYEKYFFIPTINESHDSLYDLAGQYAYLFKANHIEISESAPTVVIEKLLTVSDAYLEGIENSEGEKTLAVAIEDATDNGLTQIVWFTGAESFGDDMISEINFYLIVYALDWCSQSFESKIGDIPSKLVTEEMFTPTAVAYYGLPILLSIVIPAVFLITGAVILKKRKSRKPIE